MLGAPDSDSGHANEVDEEKLRARRVSAWGRSMQLADGRTMG